jgi:hypothetical protein
MEAIGGRAIAEIAAAAAGAVGADEIESVALKSHGRANGHRPSRKTTSPLVRAVAFQFVR